MGHSIEMFLRVYAKWIKTDQDQLEVAGFDQWISGAARAKEAS